jgi:two-component system, NtrC family, response regulator AtoC
MEPAERRDRPSVLVLEDDLALSSALRDYLEEEGWEVECAATAGEARTRLATSIFDLVLADYLLPDADGITVFDEIQTRSPLTKVMMMTGVRDMEVAARAFKEGADDLISKPFQITDLATRIENLMEKREQKSTLVSETARDFRPPRHLVGQSTAMKKVFRLVELIADKNATVLISGESGTGKELVARAIHRHSPRSRNPFVAINCGAIPENLLEDELFGHVRGAYTDARDARIGKFEQADGGVLFLDEIGNMPLSLQMKLLRVLEEREFEKLGSNRPVRIDVRILAATNCDLREKVRLGDFRGDLFYRLNVVPIHLAPLRERKEDIPLLVNHFLQLFADEYGAPKRSVEPTTLKRLIQCPWPGNIRELRNALELAWVLSCDSTVLMEEHFPTLSDDSSPDSGEAAALQKYLELPEEGIDLNQVVSELEKALICQSLERAGGNKGKAARLLYLKRTTLVEKLRRMNLLEDSLN